MPGDTLRFAPYTNMALQDSAIRPVGYRPSRFTSGTIYQQQQQQQLQQRVHSPAFVQGGRFPPGSHQMAPTTPGYAMDGRSHSSRGWEYSSPVPPAYTFFTPPASIGSMSQPAVGPLIHPPGIIVPPRFVSGLPPIAAAPPRIPERRVLPYGHPARGFWIDQFALVDVHRREPLPQDWHPFADPVPDVPTQPAVTGGVMAVLDYDLTIMADFVANVSCNFINLPKPWNSLTMFVEKVLSQTRLPSSTVILAITYLSKRLAHEMSTFDSNSRDPLIPTTELYEYLTMAFVLANKFLDDNTFTNTSWSDISGISRVRLNVMERTWLKTMGYSLHVSPLEQKGWSTWRKAWETWQFDATGKENTSLLSPLLSRSNSTMSSPQCNQCSGSPLPSFPSTAGWSKSTSQTSAYLTPPISPTFDAPVDSEFLSPVTPPSHYQWPPPTAPYHHPNQLAWQPLPNTRNVPQSAYPLIPILRKHLPSHFWEPQKNCGDPWCDCTTCRNYPTVELSRPKWIGMAT